MKPKAVIFDFDGIILDSSQIAFEILEKYTKGLNLKLEPENKKFWGLPALKALERLFPQASRQEIEKIYKQLSNREPDSSIALFPGALKVISSLKERGLITGLLTNRNEYWIKFYGKKFTIDYKDLFDFIQTRETKNQFFRRLFGFKLHPNHFTTRIAKPDTGVFDQALEFLEERNVKPNQTIYVGDTVIDSIASRLAGIGFIAIIGNGPLERKDFEGRGDEVKYILDSIEELPGLLKKIK